MMLSRDEETASELALEKTDEELVEVLRAYQSSWFSWWRGLLSVLVLVALGVMMYSCVEKGNDLKEYLGYGVDTGWEALDSMAEENSLESLSRWKSDPTNAGYFMVYVMDSYGQDGRMTAEKLIENAEAIDPENGFYHYLVANSYADKYLGEQCVEKIKTGTREYGERTKIGTLEEWKVDNRELYEEALDHIKMAGQKQGVVNHFFDLHLDSLEKFREMKEGRKMDWSGQQLSIAETFDYDYPSMKMFSVVNILTTKFYELSQGGTEEEIRFWIDEHLKLVDSLMGERAVLVDYLVAKAVMSAPLGNMRAAAEQAGMTEEVAKVSELIDKLNEDRDERDRKSEARRSSLVDEEVWANEEHSRDSHLMYMAGSPIMTHASDKEKIVVISRKEGRYGDHAFFGRLSTLIIFLVWVLILIGMWIFFFAKRKEVRKLSMQGLGALSFIDGVIVVFGGVILPVLLYIMINEWTALGLSVREWNILAVGGALVVIQFVGMVVTILTLSMALLRWRLAVRLPSLFGKVRGLGWVLPGLSFSAMILVGLSDTKGADLPWMLGGSIASLSFLGWVTLVGIGAFRKKEELARVTMCRGMLSVYCCLLIAFSGLYFYYEAQERYWISESEEITFKAEHLGLMAVEYNTCQQVRKELEERLDIIR